MVIKDSTYSQKVSTRHSPTACDVSLSKLNAEGALASPLDRMASMVIDYSILLTPIIYLILAPFQRMIKEGAIVSSQYQMTYAILFGFIAVIAILLLYQTICILFWGATIGKALLGLQVQSVLQGQRIKFLQSLTRAVFWIFSWFVLCIPFVAVFSNFLRRPLHDRISDTIVVTRYRERVIAKPTRHEVAMANGVYWGFGVIITTFLTVFLIKNISKLEYDAEQISALENESLLCPEVGDAQSEWPREENKEAKRLSVAMALFAAGSIDRICLQNEVEYLFLKSEASPLLYLAKSIIYSDQPEISEKYLEKICAFDPESYECKMSDIVSDVSQEDWESASKKFNFKYENAPVYFIIWAVRQYIERNEYLLAQQFAEKIPNLKILSDFIVPAQMKILWGLHKKTEVRGLETAAYSTLSDEAKLEFSSFICFENLWASCEQAESKSCVQIDDLLTKVEGGLSSIKTSLAYLRKWECENEKAGGRNDYKSLEELDLHPDVRALVAGLYEKKLAEKSGKKSDDQDELSELLNDDTLSDDLVSEISRRMLSQTKSIGSIKILTKNWLNAKETLGWIKTGETLFKKYFEIKQYEDGLKIVDEIFKRTQYLSKDILENSVVAAMRVGQEIRARKLILLYAESYPLPALIREDSRGPASESEFVKDVIRLQRSRK